MLIYWAQDCITCATQYTNEYLNNPICTSVETNLSKDGNNHAPENLTSCSFGDCSGVTLLQTNLVQLQPASRCCGAKWCRATTQNSSRTPGPLHRQYQRLVWISDVEDYLDAECMLVPTSRLRNRSTFDSSTNVSCRDNAEFRVQARIIAHIWIFQIHRPSRFRLFLHLHRHRPAPLYQENGNASAGALGLAISQQNWPFCLWRRRHYSDRIALARDYKSRAFYSITEQASKAPTVHIDAQALVGGSFCLFHVKKILKDKNVQASEINLWNNSLVAASHRKKERRNFSWSLNTSKRTVVDCYLLRSRLSVMICCLVE